MKVILFILIIISSLYGTLSRSGNSVSDSVTNLQWQDDAEVASTTRSWSDAIDYCEGLTLDTHNDWRLPNKNELRSIADRSRYSPAVDTTAFQNIPSSGIWSSTTYARNTSNAWLMDFALGGSNNNAKTNNWSVLCVRGGQYGTSLIPEFPVIVNASEETHETSVDLNWPSTSNTQSYKVYRSNSVESYGVEIAEVTTESYTDENPTFGIEQYYSVKSCNLEGCSEYSGVAYGYAAGCLGDQIDVNGTCVNPTCVGDQVLTSGVCIEPTCIGDQVLTNSVCIEPTCVGDQVLTDGICVNPTCIGDQSVIDGVCVNPTCVGEQILTSGVCINPTCIGDQVLTSGVCIDPTCGGLQVAVDGICPTQINYTTLYDSLQQGAYESDSYYEQRLQTFNDTPTTYWFDLESAQAYDANRGFLYTTMQTTSVDLESVGIGIEIAPIEIGENVANFERDMFASSQLEARYSVEDDILRLAIHPQTIEVYPKGDYQSFQLINLGLPLDYINQVLKELQKGWYETSNDYEKRVNSFERKLLIDIISLSIEQDYGYNAETKELTFQVDLTGMNLGVKTYTIKFPNVATVNNFRANGKAILTLRANYNAGHIGIIVESLAIIHGKETLALYTGVNASNELFNRPLFATAQTTSYYANDDGATKLGRAHEFSRNTTTGVVTDGANHLMWQDKDLSSTMNHSDAVEYCQKLEVGGVYNWRVPTRDELLSIADMGNSGVALDEVFSERLAESFWSDTYSASDSTKAWQVQFVSGSATQATKSELKRVRCVSGEEPVDLTFLRNDVSDTVYEFKTNMEWTDGSAQHNDFKGAIDYCQALDYGGYNDWRLPNINELRSIVDVKRYNYATNPAFQTVSDNYSYWTSTTDSSQSANAWSVNFVTGIERSDDKYSNIYSHAVRCVRGRQVSQENQNILAPILFLLVN